MPEATGNKIMTTKEAISRFVNDGDHVVIGNYTVGTCYNQIMEIIRQRKKGLTIYSQSGVFDVEMLIAGDCVSRVVSTYCMRSGGRSGGSMLERYQRAGKIEVEDYSNFTYNARLTAGAQGYSFIPVLPGIMASDVFKVRDFMGGAEVRRGQVPFHGAGCARGTRGQPGRVHRPRPARGQVWKCPVLGFAGFGFLGVPGQQKGDRQLRRDRRSRDH